MAIRFPANMTEEQRRQLQQQQPQAEAKAQLPPAAAMASLRQNNRQGGGSVFDGPQGPQLPGAAEQAMKEGGGSLAGITPERQPAITAPPPAAETTPQTPQTPQAEKPKSIFDVSPEEEKAAFASELEAQRGKAMQQAEARAGLAGMGLSGATGQLVSDVGRQQTRAGQLAMGDFERAQAAGELQDLQRQASIWAFEEEFGVDLNNDNVYGAPASAKAAASPLSEDINQDGIVDEKDKELASTFEQQEKSSRWSEATGTNPTYLASVSEVPDGYRRRNVVTSPDGKKYGFYVPEDGSGKTYLVEER